MQRKQGSSTAKRTREENVAGPTESEQEEPPVKGGPHLDVTFHTQCECNCGRQGGSQATPVSACARVQRGPRSLCKQSAEANTPLSRNGRALDSRVCKLQAYAERLAQHYKTRVVWWDTHGEKLFHPKEKYSSFKLDIKTGPVVYGNVSTIRNTSTVLHTEWIEASSGPIKTTFTKSKEHTRKSSWNSQLSISTGFEISLSATLPMGLGGSSKYYTGMNLTAGVAGEYTESETLSVKQQIKTPPNTSAKIEWIVVDEVKHFTRRSCARLIPMDLRPTPPPAHNPSMATAMEASDAKGIPLQEDQPERDDWVEIRRRRSKKVKPQNTEATISGSQPTPQRALTRQPRLPPLPRDDFKIIIRPRGALNLANLETIHLSRAIAEKTQQHTRDRPNSTTFQVRMDRIQNIAIASTPSEDLTRHIRDIPTLRFGDNEYEVTAYIVAPDDSARGVVRGIPPGTTGQELIDNLYSPGYEILSPKMIEKTSTALITFTGRQLPKYVVFEHAALPCSWYLPTRHACYICHEIGHRADVCPNPDTVKRPPYGLQGMPKKAGSPPTNICLESPPKTKGHSRQLPFTLPLQRATKDRTEATVFLETKVRFQVTIKQLTMRQGTSGTPSTTRQQHGELGSAAIPTKQPKEADHFLFVLRAGSRRSLIKRWRRQKHNRTLKIRIAKLTEEAADYAVDLMQQNWQQFCNSLQGTLGTAKTWSLLRHLLDPTKSNYPGRLAMAVSVIDEDMREVTTATVPTSLPLEAEEAAIALAITSTPAITSLSIITDSQAACRSFGNARALTLRAPPPQEDPSLVPIPIPLTYRDILQHLRLSRRTLPPPHKSLTREDAVVPNPNAEQWEAALSSWDPDDQRNLVSRARTAATATGALE
ncbi:hypothetical protein HPB47_018175 [Ixodes persulcatus]|uniref:Uncharacterized protein n=1 Tax=Ixodes persulcatus TaxID=34615 RepID=A0AC60R1A6_IXOPE|nr:hypothetical protein HPB47_018175 [Ixodes persulcatus]